MNRLNDNRRMLEYGLMGLYSNIFCFSTKREGGYSTGSYASLNCTPYTGDNPEAVRENQELLRSWLPGNPKLLIPVQTHSDRVLMIDDSFLSLPEDEQVRSLYGVDALVTQLRGICLCISTADCVPVMMYDREHQVIGIAHAGWRGTVARIVEKTLEQMKSYFGTTGNEVVACVGPSISLDSFETVEEVVLSFQNAGFDMKRISKWNADTSKWHIDLWQANVDQLIGCGVPSPQIEVVGICTYKNVETYFSARKLGVKSGRILSGLMLK